ncbi:Glycosyltransferase involved in cell wall bisynthesis [Natronoarchaeum philippinense]|uniref:Glycosyltransferase involved in cell wall bisynthesis n=1 Tax=Natronoarchaeum philippinense TaxID=558529 RepID=A0A285N4D9_NATPI|nr:glycosyltransferase family 4 protein [Natronoarchaeum philippinense]SNZ04322.1 Glycosyltransferase involved in cell wall bisynthesis [Natronoarchaeum philippinense]
MEFGFYHEAAGTRHASGIAIYVQRMAAELADDHEVYLYTEAGETTPLLRDSGVELIEIPPFEGRLADAADRVVPLSRQNLSKIAMAARSAWGDVVSHIDEHVDVLCTFQFMDDLLISRLVDAEVVYLIHGVENVGVGAKARDRLTAATADVANTADTARKVREKLGYHVDHVVRPGVDVDLFRPDAPPAFDAEERTVLFVGRFVDRKGVFDLVDAFAPHADDATLRLVGRGDADAVHEAARERGIAESVVVDGVVPHDDLPGYYTAADVFCLPSHAESFGMVNLEAMACGTPVVSTDLPGIREYAVDDDNAVLVRPESRVELSDALGELLESPERRTRLGERGRQTALSLSWGRQATRLADFCRETVGQQPDADTDRRPTGPLPVQ